MMSETPALAAPDAVPRLAVRCVRPYRIRAPPLPAGAAGRVATLRDLRDALAVCRRGSASSAWADAHEHCERLRRLEDRGVLRVDEVVRVAEAEAAAAAEAEAEAAAAVQRGCLEEGRARLHLHLSVCETTQRLTQADWADLVQTLREVGYDAAPRDARRLGLNEELRGSLPFAVARLYEAVESSSAAWAQRHQGEEGEEQEQEEEEEEEEDDGELWRRLHPHQRSTVRWMRERERRPAACGLFERCDCDDCDDAPPLWLWHGGQQLRCSEPTHAPGGVLAQEVGMGKTVEAAALIRLGRRGPPPPCAPTRARPSLRAPRHWRALVDASRTTLVVCPVTILGQWQAELAAWGGDGLRVLVYYGPHRDKRDDAAIAAADVVLTTFETLAKDVGRLPSADVAGRAHHVERYREARDDARAHWEAVAAAMRADPEADAELQRHAAQASSALRRADIRLSSAEVARACIERAWNGTALARVRFGRLVVDEAHRAHDTGTMISASLEAIEARARWALSATPLSLTGDTGTHGVAHLLRMEPFRHSAQWSAHGRPPWVDGYHHHHQQHHAQLPLHEHRGRATVALFWAPVLWRQSKSVELGHTLPPRVDREVRVALTEREGARYAEARRSVAEAVRGAAAHRQMRLSTMLAGLRALAADGTADFDAAAWAAATRLRESGSLAAMAHEGAAECAARLLAEGAAPPETLLAQLRELCAGEAVECPICYESMLRPALTPCGHLFCTVCVATMLGGGGGGRCPTCRQAMNAHTLRRITAAHQQGEQGPEPEQQGDPQGDPEPGPEPGPEPEPEGDPPTQGEEQPPCGSKVAWIVQHVASVGHKVVVSSNFQHACRAVQDELARAGVRHASIHGGTSQAQRQRALKLFEQDDDVRVFVLTRGAASVGVNLVAASEVVLMEPALSAAVEDQIVGRIHRLGQRSPTTVTRLVAEDTVEDGILRVRREGSAGGRASNHMLLRVL